MAALRADDRNSRLPQLPTLELPSWLEFIKLKGFPLKVYPSVYERPSLTNDTLYIYGPGSRQSWASFDVECLEIQVYLKMCGIDFDVVNSNEPDASPSRQLPYLATVTGAVYDQKQILTWIKERKMDKPIPDNGAGKAFLSLVKTKLHDALLFSLWLEPLPYSHWTSKAYYGHVPAPINSLLAYQRQNALVQQLLTNRDVLVREEIYRDAELALEALSVKLGDDTYFSDESSPSWLDAVVFSYLHIILSASHYVPSAMDRKKDKQEASTLRNLVRKHENLVRYCKAMHEAWL